MNTERKWVAIGPTSVTADGQENGILTVEDTACYKVKMKVTLQSDSFQQRRYEIKQVISRTQMRLGEVGSKHNSRADLTDWVLVDNPILKAPEQDRPDIPPADYESAVYSEEPTMAKRIIPVNKYGQENSPENPLYAQLADGDINIGTVNAELEVQLSSKDDDPDAGDIADSVRVGDQNDYARITTSKDASTAGLNTVNLAKPFTKPWNSVEVTQKNQLGDPTEIITSFNGVQVQKATIVYDQRFDFESLTVEDL